MSKWHSELRMWIPTMMRCDYLRGPVQKNRVSAITMIVLCSELQFAAALWCSQPCSPSFASALTNYPAATATASSIIIHHYQHQYRLYLARKRAKITPLAPSPWWYRTVMYIPSSQIIPSNLIRPILHWELISSFPLGTTRYSTYITEVSPSFPRCRVHNGSPGIHTIPYGIPPSPSLHSAPHAPIPNSTFSNVSDIGIKGRGTFCFLLPHRPRRSEKGRENRFSHSASAVA